MKPILYVRPLGQEPASFLDRPYAQGIDQQRVYDLPDLDLTSYGAILVSAHTDQRAFAACRDQIAACLDAGGLLVFNGHIAYPCLPELAPFVPVPGFGLDLLQIRRTAAHPVFDGVDPRDLTFRLGVAGFYGRGHNPPPPGATVLHRLSGDDAPLDWVWERPAGGTVFMHGGNNLWMYADDPTSAARIAPQLMAWVTARIEPHAEKETA
jgi:hypothetical protein